MIINYNGHEIDTEIDLMSLKDPEKFVVYLEYMLNVLKESGYEYDFKNGEIVKIEKDKTKIMLKSLSFEDKLDVSDALKAIIDRRTPAFSKYSSEARKAIRKIVRTKHPYYYSVVVNRMIVEENERHSRQTQEFL